MIVLTYLLFLLIATMILAEQSTRQRSFYKLDRDVTSLEVGSSIHVELTFTDSNSPESVLEIETDKWVHDCCLEITKKGHLRLYLKPNQQAYPQVTAYLRLRKPICYINLNQRAHLVMQNVLKTDQFFVELFQATHAHMKLQISSYLYISLSDAARMSVHGLVNESARFHVRQAAKLDARCCHINKLVGQVNDAGSVELSSVKSFNLTAVDMGQIRYDNSSKFVDLFDFNWMKKRCGSGGATVRSSVKKISMFLVVLCLMSFS